MLKIIMVITVAFLFFPRTGWCADLYWYMAASMSKPGREMVETFNQTSHSFNVVFITGGSGQLLSKIKTSGKGDLFTPAGMRYLTAAQDMNMVKEAQPLITQTPVFALSKSGGQKIHCWSDLTRPGMRIGLGNPKTMALGQTFQKISTKMGRELTEKFRRNRVVETVNVSQIINYLKADIIDAGISFASTAKANQLDFIEIPPVYNQDEVAPLIRLQYETDPEHTNDFIHFMMHHLQIFKKYGFNPVKQE